MGSIKYRVHPASFVRDHNVWRENCVLLIASISKFYFKYEDKISLKDKKQILKILARIEQCKELLPYSEKERLFESFYYIKDKYCMR